MKANVEANKYLLLQKVTTLNEKQNEDIIEYFKQTKNLTKHLFNATKTIDYNVIKKMKNKSQKKRVNFECNKNEDLSLRKIKQIIQATYQMINTVNSFDFEWRQIENSFNLFKEKNKALSSEKWNQQILLNILQDIKNITMQIKLKSKIKIMTRKNRNLLMKSEYQNHLKNRETLFILIVSKRNITLMNVRNRNKWKKRDHFSSQLMSYCQSKRRDEKKIFRNVFC
jgi:hypothetical protein